jgi:hypothetical protein
VEDNARERTVDLKAVVVIEDAYFRELIHEAIHCVACGPNCVRHSFLRYLVEKPLRLVLLSLLSKEQKSADQAFVDS